MKNRFLAILCTLGIIFGLPLNLYVSANTDILTTGEILSNKQGNIFSPTDTITFTQHWTNNVNERIEVMCNWVVVDEAGDTIGTKSWSGQLEASSSANPNFTIDNPVKFGLYKIRITEQTRKKSAPSTVYSDNYEIEFSVCIPLGTQNVNPQFGYNQPMIRSGAADPDIAPQLMAKSGAKWHRESVEWSEVEKGEKGAYSISASTKNRVLKVKNSGLDIVCVLKGLNPLYNENAAPSTDEEIAAFAGFCRYVAQELGDYVDHFEIWNEWNVSTFNPTLESPQTYAKLLKAAYNAIKGVDSDYCVIGCGISGFNVNWINDVLTENGGVAYMDALSVHCYDFSEEDGFPETTFIESAESVKELLESYNIDIPLWITEAGFSTYDNNSGFVPGCTEDVQLNSMVMLNAVNKAYGLVDNIIQFCLNDRAIDASHIEANWGVLNCYEKGEEAPDDYVINAAKPAYLGVAAMNYFIGGNADFISKTANENTREYAFKFNNKNLNKTVMLLINGGLDNSTTRNMDLGCTEVEMYDKYGNYIGKRESLSGIYRFDTSVEPLYVVGSFDSPMQLNTYINYNTGIATVSGKTDTPNDIVSLMLVTDGEPLVAFDASRIKYLGQTTADSNGNFEFEIEPDDPFASYQVYINSDARRGKSIQDVVFTYSASGIKVFKNGTEVSAMAELSAGDSANVKIGGVLTTQEDNAKILVAQYSADKLVDVSFTDAAGDASTAGNEIAGQFTVGNGIDRVKVMYWKMDSMIPIVESYELH